jgi:hypothetical protein
VLFRIVAEAPVPGVASISRALVLSHDIDGAVTLSPASLSPAESLSPADASGALRRP